MIREQVKSAQVEAMKAGDKEKLAAVRLILAKLKDRDIELRTATSVPDDDAVVVDVLQKMVKQRRESIEMFKSGGRDELAAKEEAELAVIEEFLPKQMCEAEVEQACQNVVQETGAEGLRDVGKCMSTLKQRFAGQMDFSKASGVVKSILQQ